MVNLLRSGLVRNLGNISAPRLFNRAFAGTKLLIEDYITQVAQAVTDVTHLPTTPGAEGNNGSVAGFSSQAKLDLLHDTRQAFGRSTLVLQGGAIFGLCHLGVVKALFNRGLLPRIVTGTATGALIAALVGIHTEDELPKFLNGESIDLSAFTGKEKALQGTSGWWDTLTRRVKRFYREGYFLDVKVLEECVRANVGDLTFEEAYNKTKRVLNITVATSGKGGVPNLLNYLTAPNVVSIISTSGDSLLTEVVNLVCCPRIKRFHPLSLRILRDPKMQRSLNRHHYPLVGCRGRHLSPMDARLLYRSRFTPLPHRRALQRKPLHSIPSATLPRPLPTIRHARPVSSLHSRRTHLSHRRFTTSHNHGNPSSTPTARFPSTSSSFHS